MKAVILALCALLCLSCSGEKKEEHVEKKQEQQQVYVPPPPANTNPFDKPAPPPPLPAFSTPHWVQAGEEFKINEHWSFWTWRDEANHATCYITIVDSNAGQMSMSCVRE